MIGQIPELINITHEYTDKMDKVDRCLKYLYKNYYEVIPLIQEFHDYMFMFGSDAIYVIENKTEKMIITFEIESTYNNEYGNLLYFLFNDDTYTIRIKIDSSLPPDHVDELLNTIEDIMRTL